MYPILQVSTKILFLVICIYVSRQELTVKAKLIETDVENKIRSSEEDVLIISDVDHKMRSSQGRLHINGVMGVDSVVKSACQKKKKL